MQIHLLITLPACIVIHEATATTLDLHTTARFLLDVLDVAPARTNNLSTQIEARDWLEVDGNALFRPLAATERIALDLRLLSTTEAALVDEIG